jgi:DNA-binding NarL/FixJ family response regulator/DNA-binding PadR family transcriptional regulator
LARVLIVDDEAIITMQLEGRMSALGHKVVGMASSGEDAIAKARAAKPEIVLMDIVMPGKMNGIAAAKVINEELKVPVIFITSYADDKIIHEAKQVNPYGYIVKPFNELELKAAVELALFRKLNDNHELANRNTKKMRVSDYGRSEEGHEEESDNYFEPVSKAILLNNFYSGIILILYAPPITNEATCKNAIEYGIANRYRIIYAYYQSQLRKHFLKEIQNEQIRTHRMKPGEVDLLLHDLEMQMDVPPEPPSRTDWMILIDFYKTRDFESMCAIKDFILHKKESGFRVSGIIALNIENLSQEQITSFSSGITKVIISTSDETSISIASQSYPLESLSIVPQAVVDEICKKSLEPLVLSILTKPISGYDIIHEIHHRHNVLIPQSRVYPILYELEKKGIVAVKISGKSKLYVPTEPGKTYIRQKLNEFKFTFQHIFGVMNNESESIRSTK